MLKSLFFTVAVAATLFAGQDGAPPNEAGNEPPRSDGGGYRPVPLDPPWRTMEADRASSRGRDWSPRPDGAALREFELNPERREEILEVVNDLRPLSDQDREHLQAMSQDDFRKILMQGGGRIFYLARLRKTDAELYGLKIQELLLGQAVAQGAREYRRLLASDVSAADAARVTLESKLEELFDVHLKLREHETRQLEQQIARMQERLTTMREQAIEAPSLRHSTIAGWMARLKEEPQPSDHSRDWPGRDQRSEDRNSGSPDHR